jgi:hypothetical protein
MEYDVNQVKFSFFLSVLISPYEYIIETFESKFIHLCAGLV